MNLIQIRKIQQNMKLNVLLIKQKSQEVVVLRLISKIERDFDLIVNEAIRSTKNMDRIRRALQ